VGSGWGYHGQLGSDDCATGSDVMAKATTNDGTLLR
jgi:hypothetical protein